MRPSKSSGGKHKSSGSREMSEAEHAAYKLRKKEKKKQKDARKKMAKKLEAVPATVGVARVENPLPRMANPVLDPQAQEQEVRENDLATARRQANLKRVVSCQVEVVVPRATKEIGEKRKESPKVVEEGESESEDDSDSGVPKVRNELTY